MPAKIKKALKLVAEAALIIIPGVVIAHYMQSSWPQLSAHLQTIKWPLLGAAWVFFLLYFFTRALAWRSVLVALGSDVSVRTATPVWFWAELSRYVPGNVWSFMSRTYLASKKGISKKTVATSLIIEIVFLLGAAILFFGLFLLLWPYDLRSLRWLLLGAIPLAVVLLSPNLLARGINFLLKKFKRQPIALTLTRRALVKLLLVYCVAWLFYGLGSVLTMAAITTVGGTATIAWLMAGFVTAWLAGYLSFITPMGFGVREGVVVAVLAPLTSVGVASLVAIAVRLWLMVSELSVMAVLAARRTKAIRKWFARIKITKKAVWIAAGVALLVFQFVFQLHLAQTDGLTTDELSHLNAGYTYVTTGDYRYNPEHPPLMKELSGLAILPLSPKTIPGMQKDWNDASPFFYDSWEQNLNSATDFLFKAGNNADQLIFWGRLPYVILTTLLGVAIFWIALREWNEKAAVVATALYALDPTVAAHGHLMNTDIGAAFGFLIVIYAAWKFLRRPVWRWALAFGVATGVALLLKYTTVIAGPVVIVLFGLAWYASKNKQYYKKVLVKVPVILAVTIAVIWAGYGFHDRVAPPSVSYSTEFKVAGAHHGSLATYTPPAHPAVKDELYSIAHPLLDLLPGDFVKGFMFVFNHGTYGQSEYLLGQTSNTGWWYYFPVMAFLKTPLPTLLLGAFAVYFILKKRRTWNLAVGLLVSAALFMAVAMTSKADLGIRYILPVLPPMVLATGYAVSQWKKPALAVLALVWLGIIFAFAYPYYMGYFNALVGSSKGYTIRSDSDVDWGQDIKRIGQYISANHLTHVYIDYAWDGPTALDYYIGPTSYIPFTKWKPGDTGYVILSGSYYNLNLKEDHSPLLDYCGNVKNITPSVLVCKLSATKLP